MSDTRVPAALLSAVKRDLRPVRPLGSPGRRTLAMLPLGIGLLVAMPMFWKWLGHNTIAPWPWWGLSGLDTVLGLAALAAAFREAIPGRELSARALSVVIGAAGCGFLLANITTQTPAASSVETWIHWLWDCISLAAVFSVPTLIVPAWLVFRALPNRPAITGALCGLGVGLMADAGLRLVCWDGGYAHLLAAHGGAIVLLVILGALSATVVERVKR